MIIDAHAHVFPRLGTDSGDQTAETQLQIIQHHVQFHVQGWRQRGDGSRPDVSLLMPSGDGIADMPDVDFRIGVHGQLECTVDGEDYYLQWYPCWFRDMAASPEIMIAYMDYLGVDMAVLQHDHIYGSLNEILSDCMRRYPGRFLPLAQIREWGADQEVQQARLEHAVETLEMKGLYFAVEAFAFTDCGRPFGRRQVRTPVGNNPPPGNSDFLVPLHESPGSVCQLSGAGRSPGPVGEVAPGYSLRLHPWHRDRRHASAGGTLRYPG